MMTKISDIVFDICTSEIANKYPDSNSKPIKERVRRELDMVDYTGATGFFLELRKLMEEYGLDSSDISFSGGIPGFAFLYLLGVSDIDPFKYDLSTEMAPIIKTSKQLYFDLEVPALLYAVFTEKLGEYMKPIDGQILFFELLQTLRSLSARTHVRLLDIDVEDTSFIKLFSNNPGGYLDLPIAFKEILYEILAVVTPNSYTQLLEIFSLTLLNPSEWYLRKTYLEKGDITLDNMLANRDDVYNLLLNAEMPGRDAFNIVNRARRGQWSTSRLRAEWPNVAEQLKLAGFNEGVINIIHETRYLPPKAHCINRLNLILRAAFFRVYYPEEFRQAFYDYYANVLC